MNEIRVWSWVSFIHFNGYPQPVKILKASEFHPSVYQIVNWEAYRVTYAMECWFKESFLCPPSCFTIGSEVLNACRVLGEWLMLCEYQGK